MKLSYLIIREVRYRWPSVALMVLSLAAAVGSITAVLGALASYDARTERLASQRQQEMTATMDKLQEDFRKLTLKMGYTTVIVHKDQNLGEMFAKGFATITMAEASGDALAKAKVTTINHVLPTLQQRMLWPERNDFPVQLIGVKGEVYVQSSKQVPMLEVVPDGGAVIGQQLQRTFGLKIGDSLVFKGRTFRITALRPGRGGAEDVGLWVPLAVAQDILGQPNRINAILAVECMCPGDRVAVIQREIGSILPDAQVFEFAEVASARSEARRRVMDAADSAAQQERQRRLDGRREKELLAGVLTPIVAVAALVWVGLLMGNNVRDRRAEIGLLRALGVHSWKIAGLFLGKAMALGIVGEAIGAVAGFVVVGRNADPARQLAGVPLLPVILLGGLLLVFLATLFPALAAARQDPAAMLRDD